MRIIYLNRTVKSTKPTLQQLRAEKCCLMLMTAATLKNANVILD